MAGYQNSRSDSGQSERSNIAAVAEQFSSGSPVDLTGHIPQLFGRIDNEGFRYALSRGVGNYLDGHFDTRIGHDTVFDTEVIMSRTFSYCRVSTHDQNTDNQCQEIASAGFHVEPQRIVTETISGSTAAAGRPQFSRLMDRLERGDVLVVTKLDRLGRNALDVRSTVEGLAVVGVKVHCLALGGVDLTSAAGRMTMSVIAAVAEFERDLIIERTQAGLKRAKAAGKRLGRPGALAPTAHEEIMHLRANGSSLLSLAKSYGVSKSAIQRVERKAKAKTA